MSRILQPPVAIPRRAAPRLILLALALAVLAVPVAVSGTLPIDVPTLPGDATAPLEKEAPVDPSKLPLAGNDEAPKPAVSEERARTDSGPSFPTWIAAAVGAAGVAVGLVARRLAPTEANPRSPPPAPRRMQAPSADQLVAHGFTLLEERRFAQAVQPLREGIRSRPTDPVTRYALASALARSRQTPEALRQFDYAIRLNERFLALLLKDPDLDEFIRHADVHRFIRAHAARYRERVQRPYA